MYLLCVKFGGLEWDGWGKGCAAGEGGGGAVCRPAERRPPAAQAVMLGGVVQGVHPAASAWFPRSLEVVNQVIVPVGMT